MINEAIYRSSDPEYFSYSKISETVTKINSAVNPKSTTLIESIAKLKIKTPINTGILFIRTDVIAPIRKINGKFIIVVSNNNETIQTIIIKIVN